MVIYLQVIWKRLYKPSSGREHSTMFQLRNLINRRNMVKKPIDNANACEDFFDLVVITHILAAAMEFLGMESLEDEPNQDILPPDVWMHDDAS